MNTELIRVYKTVHTWTAIVAGMALFIAFYAGALTVFKEPLARWAAPAPARVAAVPLDDAPALITRTLASQPAATKDFRLHLKPAEHLPGGLSWQVRAADADDHDGTASRHYAATLDAEGALRVGEIPATPLADFIDVLHRVVGLPFDTDANRWLMGAIAALYALALVSGVIVLLPTLVSDFFALRLGRNLKRMWLDAHNVVGIVSLPFHVVMALTAAVFAFHDGIYFLQDKVVHEGKLASAWNAGRPPPGPAAPRDPATMLPPAELLARVQALSPSFDAHTMQYVQVTGPRAAVRVWGHDATAVAPRAMGGFVALDPYSGRVINADNLPGHQSAPYATVSSFFALHFGSFGGAPVQWMYFLLALAGAWLFYGGNLLWVESRRKAQRRGAEAPVQRRDALWLAAGTVGVCLGCVCGISLTIVAAKWLHGQVDDLAAWHRYVYYAVFLGSVAWAFVRGAARAAVDLLWLATACTAAIPLTTLLAWAAPALGLWAHGGPALGVDGVALVASLGFAWMARATARRVRHGPADSVWSAAATRRPAAA